MIFVSSTEGERFYLRMLLTHIRGATCYEDLRIFENKIYSTFKESCIARGLLGDDNEWNLCMKEASEIQTGSELRNLFALILSTCEVTYPLKLWENHNEALCEDILYKEKKINNDINNPPNNFIKNKCLNEIEKILLMNNKSLKMFPEFNWLEPLVQTNYFRDELNYCMQTQTTKYNSNKDNLTLEQSEAFEDIISCINSEKLKDKMFFINGFGGSGKTYFYNTVLPNIRSEGKIAIAMASSGIASLLLEGGRTAHFKLKIPLKCNRHSTCDIKPDSDLAKLIQQATLFIWEEAPMLDKYVYETVDRSFRDKMKAINPQAVNVAFGGKIMIFGGDFRQILPKVKHGNRSKIVSSCLNRSFLWKYMNIYQFTTNKRIQVRKKTHKEEQKEFSNYILRVGEGIEQNQLDLGDDIIKLSNEICMPLTDSLEAYIFQQNNENLYQCL
jgi:hypothetical protein